MLESCQLEWTSTREINTRGGVKLLRTAAPTEQFWNLYKVEKENLKDCGISISKFNNIWAVNHWSIDGEFKTPTVTEVIQDAPLDLMPLVNDKVIEKLKDYQKLPTQIIIAAMNRYNCSLDAASTGLGKTYLTLAASIERGRRLLVICPKSITLDWMRAAADLGTELAGVFGWEWVKTGKTPFAHWEYIEKPKKGGGVTRIKDKWVWDIPNNVDIVFDELHRASAIDTQNAMIVIAAVQAKIPIYGLSATIADDPTKMNAVGQMLGLHKGGKDFYSFMMSNGVYMQRFKIGNRQIEVPKFGGSIEHLKKIHKQIFPNKGVRIRAEDIHDFPETQIIAKAYEIEESSGIQKAYNEMQAEVDKIMASKDTENKQACILVEILRARQRVELLKIPLFLSLTRDALSEGMSVIICVNFKDTLNQLVKDLKIKSVVVGGQKDMDRRNCIDNFQENKHTIIAGIIGAMREGINLHDVHGGHPRMSLISPCPSAFSLKQVLGRPHRTGGKSKSIQRILYSANTVEENVCHSLATKLDRLSVLMDGDLNDSIFPSGYSAMRTLNKD